MTAKSDTIDDSDNVGHHLNAILKMLETKLPTYLLDVKQKHSENAKAFAFISFIQNVFGIKSEELDFEKSVKSSTMKMRGRIDATFGSVIIEFKKDLNKDITKAKEELIKYFQSYREKGEINFLGIVTDGIKFQVFHPIVKNDVVIDVLEQSSLNMEKETSEKIFLWFDAFFFATDKIIPTSTDIKYRFGLKSPTFFAVCKELEAIYEKLEVVGFKPASMKYQSWSKYLELVYGTKQEDKDLFIRHTYMATLVKLLVHSVITTRMSGSFDSIPPILYGDIFKQSGIMNFMEDDFFIWPMSLPVRQQSSRLFCKLLQEIQIYDLSKITEDVLKDLYQKLVDPEIRHSLGEFYTPDWLADTMINDMITDDESSILDPSCGSGTFLFKSIRFKKQKLLDKGWSKSKILEHVMINVVGMDIHPLAIIIAKTNYLLAIQDLLQSKKSSISIPIYLSDSLRIPMRQSNVYGQTVFEFEAADRKFGFPPNVASDIRKMDDIVELMRQNGEEYQSWLDKKIKSVDAKSYTKNVIAGFKNAMLQKNYTENESLILADSLQTLFDLIDNGMDSVWPFLLRNMYKPVAIALNKVDNIIGNPPWLVLKNMKNTVYQNFLKEQSREFDLIDKPKNIPHIELSSLFFCHVVKSYLRDGGKIGFVMPRSILVSSHHANFRKFQNPRVRLDKIYDLEKSNDRKVNPLFRIPSSVLFATKDADTVYPVPSTVFAGNLSMFNAQIDESDNALTKTYEEYNPVLTINKENYSYYHKEFSQGATIVPNAFWFVEIDNNTFLGSNFDCPSVRSVKNSLAKSPWKTIIMNGNVESEFLHSTIISSDIVPFGHIKKRLVLLPLFVDSDNTIEMLTSYNQDKIFGKQISKYLEIAEQHWKENASINSRRMSIYTRLNYHNSLINQHPKAKFKVLYVTSATYMTSCVINNYDQMTLKIGENNMIISNIFSDSTTYWYDAENLDEAHYLCSIFNSKLLDKKIKPYQPRGAFGGARHIHKTPLMFNIPKFDPNNSDHLELSKLSKMCSDKSSQITAAMSEIKSIGTVRSKIRKKLNDEFQQIDSIVGSLLEKRSGTHSSQIA